ncbi:MAG TPA: cytochrome c [Vicinamibacterales bacterium]|nr:cytochrome c [Vicinamibacterales bacterium]
MKKTCSLFMLFALAAGVAATELTAGQTAPAATAAPVQLTVELPDNPMAGAQLFVSKHCVRCHALGSSHTPIGPDLGRIRFQGTVLDLAGAFWNHAPMMREKMKELKIQRPAFNTQEMADLLAFLTAYRYYVTRPGEVGDAGAGEAVFAAKRCSSCHKTDWRTGQRLSAILLAQELWNHGAGIASTRFSGREMSDLLAYLQARTATADAAYVEPGSPRRGGEVYAEKRCASCHSVHPNLIGSTTSVAALMANHPQPRARFSSREMADVIAYLNFVNYANVRGTPARGAEVFVAKCSTCHSIGGGRQAGPDLGTMPGLDEPIGIVRAMWNHAPEMEQEHLKRGLAWPRFELNQAADLAAFLLSRRAAAAAAADTK